MNLFVDASEPFHVFLVLLPQPLIYLVISQLAFEFQCELGDEVQTLLYLDLLHLITFINVNVVLLPRHSLAYLIQIREGFMHEFCDMFCSLHYPRVHVRIHKCNQLLKKNVD